MTTPNMQMDLPTVGVTIGPDWAAKLVTAIGQIIDQHNHATGKGVKVGQAGLNINGDLTFNSVARAIGMTGVKLVAQTLGVGGTAGEVGQLVADTNDLWWNDFSGNIVQLTKGGLVNVPATNVLIDAGAKAAATTYASPAWTAGKYDAITLFGKLASFNAGATWQAYWQFQGPPNNGYYSSHYWGSTAAGTAFLAQGGPGGGRAELLEDALAIAAVRWVQGTWYPKMGFGFGRVYTAAPTAALQWTEFRAATTDATPVTGLTFDFNGNSLGWSDMKLVGHIF